MMLNVFFERGENKIVNYMFGSKKTDELIIVYTSAFRS